LPIAASIIASLRIYDMSYSRSSRVFNDNWSSGEILIGALICSGIICNKTLKALK